LAKFQKVVGTISKFEPVRTFVDGVFCRRLEFVDDAGVRREFEEIFFTNKMSPVLKRDVGGEFYFWNLHCYAFRSGEELLEDIDGVRASYFKRDARLLIIMALSIVLLPYSLFVIAKKTLRGSSRERMRLFLSASSSPVP